MSGKNFRDVPADQRTNAEGKQVLKRTLLATSDAEYELMRADLAHLDLPSHPGLHEPTQNIEFAYFPNRAAKVVNRRKLEKSACECYSVTQRLEDELGLRSQFFLVLDTPQTATPFYRYCSALHVHFTFDVNTKKVTWAEPR